MSPSLVQVQKQRLALNKPMQDLKKQVVALETGLKRSGNPEVATHLKKLRGAVKEAQTGLLDELDLALNESNEAKRAARYKSAGKTANMFFKMLRTDPSFSALEDNPISPVPALGDLQRALAPLVKTLA